MHATHVIHVSSSLISTHATQLDVIYASTLPTQPALARYPRKHTTHATHVSMPPHASTLPTQPSLARSHVNHASTNSKPFFKLFQQKLGKIDPRSGNFIHSKRCMIPFLNVPLRRTISKQLTISITQKLLIDQEIMEMHMEYHIPDQFLSNILQLKKKNGGNRPCINLKTLSKFISHKHFKMKGLHCLKYLLVENDFLGKTVLKDANFSVPLCMSSRKFVKLAWLGNLYEFLCL